MFTLIALGVGRRLRLQRRRDAGSRRSFRPASACTAASRPYFDTAVVITVLVLLGQVLELRARGRTSAAIRQLLGLAPKTARVIRDGQERRHADRRRHGRRPSARSAGRKDSGGRRRASRASSAVDESMVTGEPMPVEKAAGQPRHRRHHQRHRFAHRCARSASAATRCWRRSCGWSARRSARARRSSGSRIDSPAGSSRRWC